MKLTKEIIKALDPCVDGYRWYLEYGTDDLKDTLLKVNDDHHDWARWLYTKLMSTKQCRMIALFGAELVLSNFEKEFPGNDAPRKAIEACRTVILEDNAANRSAASSASSAAWSAAWSAWSAAWSASSAAYSAAWSAAAAASSASSAAWSAARKAMEVKLILEAIRLLECEK